MLIFPMLAWVLSVAVIRAATKRHEHGRHIPTTTLLGYSIRNRVFDGIPHNLMPFYPFLLFRRMLRNLRITLDTPAVDGIMALLDYDGVGTCGLRALMEVALCHPEEGEVRSVP